MDHLVKSGILLSSGLLLWLIPPAFQFGKVPAVFCQLGALACLTASAQNSKRLILIESILAKETILEGELIDSELAWKAENRERQLQQQYLLEETENEVLTPSPQVDPREQLERSLETTNQLIDELIGRQKLEKKSAPSLSQEGQKLLEYASKKDWIELRTLAKNWGKHNGLNSKEVEAFCQELIQAELAEWDERGRWRVIPKNE